MREHILSQLAAHRARFAGDHAVPPLIVGVQGPQGSGKTYLTSLVRDALSSPPDALSVAVLSLDDLYLPHDRLVALSIAHPENALLRGRGQPGTHDVELGTEVLRKLKYINEDRGEVELPNFDKSLFSGEGDRSAKGMLVRAPVDVVLFEGWCVGFYPISLEEIDRRWTRPVSGLVENFFESRGYRIEDVIDVNERLKAYLSWWKTFDTFIQLKPADAHPYTYIYKWRLEQEHYMKARNGGKGMTDTQVEAFVDRYIPGYVFFGDGVTQGTVNDEGEVELPPWVGRGLRIQIGYLMRDLNDFTGQLESANNTTSILDERYTFVR
ncbi:putative ATP-dependent kinase TDA10 [Grifola frondosa]|uniref:Putative ATP-dependent kinase TDA10 n=1 Tax=Grifola frondosa TaxID=5627 RepID=A0A1C7LYZ3_GRIFR|nr:putative ATP-dependent kinase TDA10 [Grifola frondosa]